MSNRVSISKCKVRDEKFWRVRWHEAGKVHRKFFTGRDAAEAHAAKIRGEAVGVKHLLAAIPQHEQEKLVMVYHEARRRGVDILTFLSAAPAAASASPALADVLTEMESAKRKSGCSERYLTAMRCVLDGFAAGRERMPISQISLPDIEAFLDSKQLRYRSTLRARLSTLFKFAVRRDYRADNPCARLEPIKVTAKPPAILSVEQTEKLLKWLKKHPRSLAWFVLSTFAGLRPEEAAKTSWNEIHFDEGWIRVEAQTTKVRQRRVVYPLPMVMDWLKLAKRLKSKLPVNARMLKLDRKRFRKIAGFEQWPKDVTRHTAASMWLANCGSAATVATALGHSESVLRKNYMALVTKVDAERFWALVPG